METTEPQSAFTVRAIMDAFPAPLFILDADLHVHAMNAGAEALVGPAAKVLGKQLCGSVLGCAHLDNASAVCGQMPQCRQCPIRHSVEESNGGKDVVRQWSNMQLGKDGEVNSYAFLVSVSAIEANGGDRFLLVLEDVTEIVELRRLLPICSVCGVVRSDDNYWQSVEEYLHAHTGVRFSHGLCPDCLTKVYGDISGSD